MDLLPPKPKPTRYCVAEGCSIACGRRQLGPGEAVGPCELTPDQIDAFVDAGVLKAVK